MKKIQWLKYIVTFLITAGIFVTVFMTTKVINEKKFSEIRNIQDKISIDLLSSETQFSLLKQSSCPEDGNSILAPEIGTLGERLVQMENTLGSDNDQVVQLKKYYSLLQIKDYLLSGEFSKKCDFKPITIVYFYNAKCDRCGNQGDVLTALRAKYPELRVYAFDTDLDLSAIETFKKVSRVAPGGEYPVTIINSKVYRGFQSIETIEKMIPELKELLKVTDEKEEDKENKTTAKETQPNKKQ
jgi:hypothetical protein